jgi:hypothetical protein
MSVTEFQGERYIRPSLKLRTRAFLAGLSAGFEAYVERHARLDEIQRLQALTDAELARLGIQRDRIVHHVFRDKFHF